LRVALNCVVSGSTSEFVVTGDTGIALLEPANRLGDLFGAFELPGADPPTELVEIGEQAALLFDADGAVLVAALALSGSPTTR
jgi:hypothetical protein